MVYAVINKGDINWRSGSKRVHQPCTVCKVGGGKEQQRRLYSIQVGAPIVWWMSEWVNIPSMCTVIWFYSSTIFFKKEILWKCCKTLFSSICYLPSKLNVWNLTAIFINNLSANVIVVYKYLILDFYDLKLGWKNRKLIFPKASFSTKKEKNLMVWAQYQEQSLQSTSRATKKGRNSIKLN